MSNSKKKKKRAKKEAKNSPKTIKKTANQKQIKTTTPASNSFNSGVAIAALLLAAVTFFVYRGALDNDFVDWDDFTYVIENNLVRSQQDMTSGSLVKGQNMIGNDEPSEYTTTLGDVFRRPISLNYHPLTILTMRWNNNICPECSNNISARPFILWNIILHILNSILVLLLIYKLTDENLLAAAVVAAIFALHPMHVESVAWVSERKDVLYTFFLLGGLLSYVRYLEENAFKWLAITYGLFVCACLSKAMAVIFPLLMLLIHFWRNKNDNSLEALREWFSPKMIKDTALFFATSLFFGIMASKVQAGGNFLGMLEVAKDTSVAINDFDTFSLSQRFQFACYGFLQYIIRFFAPHDMCAFHAYPTQEEYDMSTLFMVLPLIVIGIFAATICSLKHTKAVFVGIGFYFVSVALVLQFVSVGVVIMADRYTYIPYIGLAFMLVALVIQYFPKMQTNIFAGMLVFAALMGFMTIKQVETWSDSETLWTHVIDIHTEEGKMNPKMEQPLSIRGNAYGKLADRYANVKRDPQMAQMYLEKAFNDFVLAEKLGSKRVEVYQGLGNSYGMKKEYQKALAAYSKAIEIDDSKGSVYFNRGVTYSILRNHPNAIADYTKALELSPSNAAMAYTNRGISYVETGQAQKALADFQNTLKFDPNNQVARRYIKQLTGK